MGWFRKNARDYLNQGAQKALRGEYEQAIQAFTKALEMDAEMVEAYVYRGMAYLEMERVEEALEDFNAALRLDPETPDAYFNRAQIWRRRKEWAKAEADFVRTLQLDPTRTEAWALLGVVRALQGKAEGALKAIDQAIAQGHPEGYWIRGLILEELGHLQEAAEAYKASIREEKQNEMKARIRLGQVLARLGRREEALREWEWVLAHGYRLAPEVKRRLEAKIRALRAGEQDEEEEPPFGVGEGLS